MSSSSSTNKKAPVGSGGSGRGRGVGVKWSGRKEISSLFLTNTKVRKYQQKEEERSRTKWEKLRKSVQDKTFFETLSLDLSKDKLWANVDMNQIITDSWLMEKSDLNNLEIEIAPDFLTPKRQVELLETTSNELNHINTRVNQTLLQYETVNNQDDVFQLLEEDDEVQFTTGFDRKSIMEESKGKVKVLIVDYNKLGMKRESVLSSLKDWFEEMKTDSISDFDNADEKDKFGDDVNSMLSVAHTAKDRLIDIHSELVDFFHQQIKNPLHPSREANAEQMNSTVQKLTKELEDSANQVREAEGKAFSLEKMLERKDEELKFYRQNDNTKTSQLKEELFQFQQQAQDKEAELQKELKRTKIQFEKVQQQLDMWVVEMQSKDREKIEPLDLKNMDPEEFKELHAKSELAKRKLASQLRLVGEQLTAHELIKEKEIQMIKAQKDEECNNKLTKAKTEHREQVDKLKEEHFQSVQQLQIEFQDKFDAQIKNFEAAVTDKESKKMIDVLKRSYEEKFKLFKDSTFEEIQRLKQEKQTKEHDLNAEWELKLQLMMDSREAEKQKLISDSEARIKREVAEIRQQLEAAQLAEQIAAHSQANQLKKTLGNELKEIQAQLQKRETIVKDLTTKVDVLNELVSREYNKIEKELDDKDKDDKDDKKKGKNPEQELRAQLMLEKKKAVELAQHRSKLEKEAAISALVSKFEYEKEVTFEQERKRLLSERQLAVEQSKHEMQLEKETTVQYLKDELSLLKQQLEKERESREKTFDLNDELKNQRQKFERIINDLKAQYEKTRYGEQNSESSGNNEKFSETIRVLELKLNQTTAENEYLRALGQRVSQEQTIEPSVIEKEPSEGPITMQLEASEATQSANTNTVPDQLPESELALLEPVVPPDEIYSKIWTVDDAKRLLAMDARIDELKDQLSKQNADSVATLLEAQKQHTSAVRELITMNEDRRKQFEQEKETLDRRIAILLIENERLRKGQKSDLSITEKAVSADEIEKTAKLTLLEKTLKEKSELESKVHMLGQQLDSTKKLLETLETSRYELHNLVKSLEWKLSQQTDSKDPRSDATSEQIKKIQDTISKERTVLTKQIQELEAEIFKERALAKQQYNTLKTQFDQERQAANDQHDQFLKGLTENYEKRIKGLTEALTACLNDPDLVDELKKDNEESIKNAHVLNEREIARVRDAMRRLEEDHKQSIIALHNNDRNELQRMHKAIERMKQEFAVMLEEEKMSLLESEQSENNLQLLEKIKAELEPYMLDDKGIMPPSNQTAANARNEFQRIVDSEIKTVSTLYSAMLSVIRNRREFSSSVLSKKKQILGSLQDEVMQKTQALIATNDRLLDSEKVLTKIKSDKSVAQFQEELNGTESKAALRDLQELVKAYKEAHKENEKTIVDLMHRITNTNILLDENKRSMTDQERTIEELKHQLEIFKKQQEASEVALAALRYQAQRQAALQNVRASTPKLRSSGSFSTVAPSPVVSVQPQQPANTQKDLPYVKTDPLEIKKLMSEPSTQEPSRQKTKSIDKMWSDVAKTTVQSEEEKKKREIAQHMVNQDRLLRAQKIGVTFAKWNEKLRLKALQKEIAELPEPNDKLAQVLRRIAERHEQAIKKWEERKHQIIEERKNQWLLLMAAVSDVVGFKKYNVALPSVLRRNDTIGSVMKITSLQDRSPSPQPQKRSSAVEYTVQMPSTDEELLESHSLNFKQYMPFNEQSRSKERFQLPRVSSSSTHLKALLDSGQKYSGYDLVLQWPGIEGKRISTDKHTEDTQERIPVGMPSPKGVRLPPLTPPHHITSTDVLETQHSNDTLPTALTPKLSLPTVSPNGKHYC